MSIKTKKSGGFSLKKTLLAAALMIGIASQANAAPYSLKTISMEKIKKHCSYVTNNDKDFYIYSTKGDMAMYVPSGDFNRAITIKTNEFGNDNFGYDFVSQALNKSISPDCIGDFKGTVKGYGAGIPGPNSLKDMKNKFTAGLEFIPAVSEKIKDDHNVTIVPGTTLDELVTHNKTNLIRLQVSFDSKPLFDPIFGAVTMGLFGEAHADYLGTGHMVDSAKINGVSQMPFSMQTTLANIVNYGGTAGIKIYPNFTLKPGDMAYALALVGGLNAENYNLAHSWPAGNSEQINMNSLVIGAELKGFRTRDGGLYFYYTKATGEDKFLINGAVDNSLTKSVTNQIYDGKIMAPAIRLLPWLGDNEWDMQFGAGYKYQVSNKVNGQPVVNHSVRLIFDNKIPGTKDSHLVYEPELVIDQPTINDSHLDRCKLQHKITYRQEF